MQTNPAKPSLGEQTEQALLQLLAPACALIEANGDILHLRGRTGMYLEPAPGDAGVNNILKMAREGLTQPLKLALHQAKQGNSVVRRGGIHVRTNGHFTTIDLSVCPVAPRAISAEQLARYLVVFEEAPVVEAHVVQSGAVPVMVVDPAVPVDVRIAALEQELRTKDKLLRSATEESNSSAEELRSAIEEMQAGHEELQASNEELATSQEEMQSLNEELATVNVEQQSRVDELARALNDNRNLLSGSGIATVFVDLQQRILSFTPALTGIIKLVSTDVGRPLGDFVTPLRDYDSMQEDITAVLDTLVTKEIKVQDKDDRWYLLRMLPYRTVENVIEGAAVTFVNISEVVKAKVDIRELELANAALEMSELRYRSVVSALSEGVVLHGRDGSMAAWNPAAERIFGLNRQEMQERKTLDPRWKMIHEDGSLFAEVDRPSQRAFRTGQAQKDVVMGVTRPDGTLVWVLVNAVPILAPGDSMPATVVVSLVDITERKRMQDALRQASEDRRLAVVLRDAHDAITVKDLEGRILAWNPGAERMYGWSEAEALQTNVRDRIPAALHQQELEKMKQLSLAQVLQPYTTQRLTKSGAVVDVSMVATALLDATGHMYAIATTERAMASTPIGGSA
jgi:PAS domain S-box-containing protein